MKNINRFLILLLLLLLIHINKVVGICSVSCSAGDYCGAADTCVQGPAGAYCPGTSPGETSTTTPIGTQCTACPDGKWVMAGSGTSVGACSDCGAGYYCSAGVQSPCPAGTWSNATTISASSSCTNCVAGKYNTGTAQQTDTCSVCADGKWSAAGLGVACTTDCGAGYYCTAGVKTCLLYTSDAADE